MRQIIALLESAPTTEGAIDNTDFELVKFMKLLNQWRQKLQDLKQTTSEDGAWVRFLNKKDLLDATMDVYKIHARLDEVLAGFYAVESTLNRLSRLM